MNAIRSFLLLLLAASPVLAQTPPLSALSEMVIVPAGPFTMGSKEGPEDEQPVHEVTLKAFSIDRFPVTNAQYAEFLNSVSAQPGKSAQLYDYDDPDARIHLRGDRWIAD